MDSTQQMTLLVTVALLLGSGILASLGAKKRCPGGDIPRPQGRDASRGAQTRQGLSLTRRLFVRNTSRKAHQLRELDAAMLCAEIATRLDAGSSIGAAWEQSLRRLDARLDWEMVVQLAAHPQRSYLERLRTLTGLAPDTPLSHLQHREATAAALRGMLVATKVSQQLGAPLAQILNRIADGIAQNLEAAAKRHTAQVGPKASARLLGFLPLLALAMAHLIGVNVLALAFSGGWESLTFIVGIALMVAGNVWSAHMIRAAVKVPFNGLEPTLAMDILAACQYNGISVTASLEAVAAASGEDDLRVVARMLLLGADWQEAWASAGDKWRDLADILQPTWQQGASPVALLQRGATRIRNRETRQAVDAAEKLGVRLVIPLGICLLPAFFALGIVPVVISTLEDLLI